MPRAEKIRAQTTPEDGPLFAAGFNNSLFKPEPHGAFTDYVREKQLLKLANTNLGNEIHFEIDKNATFIEDLILRWDVDALAVPGDGTYIRFQDFSFSQIEEVVVRYSSNHIVTYRPDNVWSDYKFMTNEKQEAFEVLHSGNLSAAERNTKAAAGQRFRFRLPMYWNDKKFQLPIIAALANKIKVTVKTRAPALCLQSDGTKPTPVAMVSPTVEMQYIHVTAKEREEFTAQTLKPNGLSYLIEEFQFKTVQASAGEINSSGKTIELNDFDGPIPRICVIVRKLSDVQSASNDPNYYNIDTSLFEDWTYKMEANGMDLFEETDVKQEIANYVSKFYCAPPSIEQILIFWDECPKYNNVASGHLSIGNFQNPKLILKSAVANTDDLVLTIIAKRWNWTNDQAGNLQKIWN